MTCRCDYFLQVPPVFSVTLSKTATANRELRLILMMKSTDACGVLHIFGQKSVIILVLLRCVCGGEKNKPIVVNKWKEIYEKNDATPEYYLNLVFI